MNFKTIKEKINFREKRYAIPLLVLLPLLYLVYTVSDYITEEKEPKQTFLSTSLGVVEDTILSKNSAYDKLYKNEDNRTMIQTIGEEKSDSLKTFREDLTLQEKRYIDSIAFVKNKLRNQQQAQKIANTTRYYQESKNAKNSTPKETNDFEQSMEIIRMLNGEVSDETPQNMTRKQATPFQEQPIEDPVKMMREQFFLLDSLEKARDPEHQALLAAEEKIKQNRKLKERFLNHSLDVRKNGENPHFNTISKEEDNHYIKAVIDQDITGYLGSRIRFRLLEDVFIAGQKVEKGKILYAHISGFSLQRVNLSVVSVLVNGEILPINLSVYDIDGMQGLYVPRSQFREMMREFGQNSVQGTRMNETGANFFNSLLSKAFTSTSKMIAQMIRANKAKLKYNSYIYLINEKQLNHETY